MIILANVDKMKKLFDEVLLKYKGAEDNYVGTIAGGGTDYKRNMQITNSTVEGYRKRFDEAAKETEPATPTPSS